MTSILSSLLAATNFLTLVVISVVFGLSSGAFVAMEPIIIADFCDPVDMPKVCCCALILTETLVDSVCCPRQAYGLVHACEAPAILIGPPIVGWIVESFNDSYVGAFLFAGLTMIVSNFFLMLAPRSWRNIEA